MVDMRLWCTLKWSRGLGRAAQCYSMCIVRVMTSAQPQHTHKPLRLGWEERVWPGTLGTKTRRFKFFSFTVNVTTEIFVPRQMVINICYSSKLL